jgi:hypothetical protein
LAKYKVVPYEVLDGEIENPFYKPPPSEVLSEVKSNNVIVLPNRMDTSHGVLPPGRERFRMINAAKAEGLDIGVSVIRVRHINQYMINESHLIGIIDKFTMHMYPGETVYRPIVVRFPTMGTAYQDFPFVAAELEVWSKAKEQLARGEH